VNDKNSPQKGLPVANNFLKTTASGVGRLEDPELAMKQGKRNDFSKAYFRLIESNAIVLLFLVVFSVALFQHALIDYPRKDHKAYLAQKVLFDNPADWCQFSVSYSRTRTLQKGDEYLFRPAHMLFLCVEDVFFEKKPLMLGAISVISAGIAAFILFLICSSFLNSRTGGLLASLCWLAFFPGIELILWRHISPYLFSLILGFGGIYYIYGNTTHNSITKHTIATAILLCASLFHEMTVVALTIFAGIKILSFIINRKRPDHHPGLNKDFDLIFPALATISLFAVLNIIDFKINGNSFISPQDKFLEDGFITYLWHSTYATIYFIGLSILALIFPFNTSLSFTGDNLMWVGLPQRAHIILLCALIGIFIMSAASYFLYKSRKPFHPSQSQLVGYSLCFLIALFLALGFLRGSMRGLSYLQWANYYLSIFTWCWIILLVFLLKLAIDDSTSWQKGSRNLIVSLSSLGAIIYMSINFYLTTSFTIREYKPRAIQYWVSQGLFKKLEITEIPQLSVNGPQEQPDSDPSVNSLFIREKYLVPLEPPPDFREGIDISSNKP